LIVYFFLRVFFEKVIKVIVLRNTMQEFSVHVYNMNGDEIYELDIFDSEGTLVGASSGIRPDDLERVVNPLVLAREWNLPAEASFEYKGYNPETGETLKPESKEELEELLGTVIHYLN
jgi:hypothetical protein